MVRQQRRGFTLIELLVVVFVLAVVIAILLPSLSSARKSSLSKRLSADWSKREYGGDPPPAASGETTLLPKGALLPLARVTTFDAKVGLTPRLSVGTAEPESIYEAKFAAKIKAVAKEPGECRIVLPLPPQIISLADLSVKVGGQESEAVSVHDGRLEWRGALAGPEGTSLDVTYSAVGKGVYTLDIPPGGILDTFSIDMTAVGSDVRMLELSLQPTKVGRGGGKTTYTWDYKRLMFGRPIALDVLGIAPVDRLGELGWLGPLSVVVFGLLVGLMAHAYQAANFDRWMLLLVIGTFTGAYPLMYFAQEFISLQGAMVVAGAVVVGIIGVRAATIMGWKLGVCGVVLPAVVVMALTLWAAVEPSLQGLLLTAGGLGFFVVAMVLAPRLRVLPWGRGGLGGGGGAGRAVRVPPTTPPAGGPAQEAAEALQRGVR